MGRPPGPLGDVARLVPEEGLTKAVAFTGFPWSWPQQLLPGSTSPLQPSPLSPVDGALPHPPLRMLRAQAGPGLEAARAYSPAPAPRGDRAALFLTVLPLS